MSAEDKRHSLELTAVQCKISHTASAESDLRDRRSVSAHDMALTLSQSHSESALKRKVATLASPVESTFARLTKGVQNLGSTFDPRKFMPTNTVRHISPEEYAEHNEMQARWLKSKTKVIAL